METVQVALAGLTIQFTRAPAPTVAAPATTTITPNTQAPASPAPSTATSNESKVSSVSASIASASPASASSFLARRLPVAPSAVADRRCYVVYECPRAPHLVGIHHCVWRELERQLPGGRLTGSSARSCKKFAILEEATTYYLDYVSDKPALHGPPEAA